jgi:hypothetical protein
MNIGDAILVKTKTREDNFGDVLYRVTEVGLDCPHCKEKDAIRFMMIGGTGPWARKGVGILDCSKTIKANIASGVTKVITAEKADQLEKHYSKEQSSSWKGKEF